MDSAFISALAAIGGSLVGGAMASVVSNFLAQRSQNRREILNHQLVQREAVYAEFIRIAAELYANSLTDNLKTIDKMVRLYSHVSHLRLMASEPVLQAAEQIVETISQQYGEPNLTIDQIQISVRSRKIDPLGSFSGACRKELTDIVDGASTLSATMRKRSF